MTDKQRTIKKEVSFSGIGVHTGANTTIKLSPADPWEGIVFKRNDVDDHSGIKAIVKNVSDTRRGTTLSRGDLEVKTVEHLLAVLYAYGIDNCIIETDGEEIPIDDGSSKIYIDLIEDAGVVELDAPKKSLSLSQPLLYKHNETFIAFYPQDGFSLTYIINYDSPIPGTQYFKYDNDIENFKEFVGPSRTFILYDDVERLKEAGLIKGGNLKNAIVIKEDEIMSGPLRHRDEFVSHKILDMMGDLCLLGMDIKGDILVIKGGHESHIEFIKKLLHRHQMEKVLSAPLDPPVIDIGKIKSFLPHRYPFLLVDKITYIDEDEEMVIGVKNITYNEEIFTGHFPEEPIMPGVLIIEAMAQAGGVLLLSTVEDPSSKLVYFVSIDNAKFRKTVRPGDCLVFKLEGIRLKTKICHMRGFAYVGEDLAAEAEFKAMLIDKK